MITVNDYLVHHDYTYGLHIDFYKVLKVTNKQIKMTKVKTQKIENDRGVFYLPTDELIADVYHEAGAIRTIKKADQLWLDGLSLDKYETPVKEYHYGIYA